MIARHCGYQPGVFTHFVANEQIYDRHITAANEMLTRIISKEEIPGVDDSKNPRLILNPDKTDFYDITIDDFQMVDYEPMKPQIKLELGI